MCPFKWVFRANLASQILHSKGFFPSWTDGLCPFMWCWCAKLASHILHSKGVFPSWKDSICVFRPFFCEKLALQVSHLKFFFPSWPDATWLFKFSFHANMASQILHWKAPFPSCFDTIWLLEYHKSCIWRASFLHEGIECAFSKFLLFWRQTYTYHIWAVYPQHNFKTFNVSNLAETFATRIILYFADVLHCKFHIWKASFHHELKLCVHSFESFMQT